MGVEAAKIGRNWMKLNCAKTKKIDLKKKKKIVFFIKK